MDLVIQQTVADMTANVPADPDGFFDVFVDGALKADDLPFGLDNLFGLNAIEVASISSDPAYGYHLYDNISMTSAPIPEPSTMLLLGSGLAGLAALRKRFKI